MVNTQVKSSQSMIDLCWNLTLVFSFGICVSMIPESAFATNAIELAFCNVVNLLTNTTGRAVATVAVIAVGIGALLGKISWGMALIVAIGVALVFGASSIVTALGSSSGNCTSGSLPR